MSLENRCDVENQANARNTLNCGANKIKNTKAQAYL